MAKGWAFLGSGLGPNTDFDMGFLILYPYNSLKILLFGSSDGEESFGVVGPMSWLAKSCPSPMPEPLRLLGARSWL